MNFFEQNWQLLIGAIGGVVTFFAGRKAQKAKEKFKGADAIKNMDEAYALWTHRSNTEMQLIRDELKKMRVKDSIQRKNMSEIKKDSRVLYVKIEVLENNNKSLQSSVQTLSSANLVLNKKLKNCVEK